MRHLRPLLLVLALLFSQHAALLHGLAHAEHEVALAEKGEKAPGLGHGSDVCAAFGALASALGGSAPAFAAICASDSAQSANFLSVSRTTRIAFDSRAPPHPA